ncbi:Hypothetical Protein XCAW_01901 [Xanthomonas citri subsp. citri Aw12879]|nr:Hypothetical Protein XCAW_01901 [Xanthomonas citri subsp. citri Aw12879]
MSPPIRPSGTFPRKREKGAALAVEGTGARGKGRTHAEKRSDSSVRAPLPPAGELLG